MRQGIPPGKPSRRTYLFYPFYEKYRFWSPDNNFLSFTVLLSSLTEKWYRTIMKSHQKPSVGTKACSYGNKEFPHLLNTTAKKCNRLLFRKHRYWSCLWYENHFQTQNCWTVFVWARARPLPARRATKGWPGLPGPRERWFLPISGQNDTES